MRQWNAISTCRVEATWCFGTPRILVFQKGLILANELKAGWRGAGLCEGVVLYDMSGRHWQRVISGRRTTWCLCVHRDSMCR